MCKLYFHPYKDHFTLPEEYKEDQVNEKQPSIYI